MQLGSPNLTCKCSTLTLWNPFILGSKGQKVKVTTRSSVFRQNAILPLAAYVSHAVFRRGLLHSCECRLYLVNEKNCPRSRIEVRQTALLRYHAHTRWTLAFDLWPLTHDLDFQSRARYGYDLHTKKLKNSKISQFKK